MAEEAALNKYGDGGEESNMDSYTVNSGRHYDKVVPMYNNPKLAKNANKLQNDLQFNNQEVKSLRARKGGYLS